MATIFDREFKREKNLEMAKRQAEMKKPGKKDNAALEKKAAQMAQMLHELEDGFFKHVAEDPEQLAIVKKRGEASHDNDSAQAKQAAQPQPAAP
jgi:hypothetical protein